MAKPIEPVFLQLSNSGRSRIAVCTEQALRQATADCLKVLNSSTSVHKHFHQSLISVKTLLNFRAAKQRRLHPGHSPLCCLDVQFWLAMRAATNLGRMMLARAGQESCGTSGTVHTYHALFPVQLLASHCAGCAVIISGPVALCTSAKQQ